MLEPDRQIMNLLQNPNKTLPTQGEWRAIAQRVRIYQKAGPERMLTEAAWHILSLVKLRNFTGAAEELAGLGDLNASEYFVNTSLGECLAENAPSLYI